MESGLDRRSFSLIRKILMNTVGIQFQGKFMEFQQYTPVVNFLQSGI